MTLSRLQPAPEAGRRPSGLAARTGQHIRRHWRAYWDRRARKATVLLLHSLDERTLRDIGIRPGEIESLVYCRGDDRLRPYDAAWQVSGSRCQVSGTPVRGLAVRSKRKP